MKLITILDHIDNGHMALPEFQRGYVWSRDQVRGLMTSLYRGYPVGGFLVWVTPTDQATSRGPGELAPGVVKLLLDGQQRVTSMYGIIRGEPPQFFDGQERAFTGLRFHALEETFEFYAPTKMKGDPLWVDVSDVMRSGLQDYIVNLKDREDFGQIVSNLSQLHAIRDRDFHIEEVTGEDMTVDVVVDIFNRVNSGGTKLSKGDLALARICAAWPQARDELRQRLRGWDTNGYAFKLDWLLRNVTTVVTGSAFFSGLRDVEPKTFAAGLGRAEASIDTLLNLLAGRLGLDHDRVLGGRYAFPVTSRYLDQHPGPLSAAETGELLHWYVHAMLWGRYAGSTESVLNQDLAALDADGLAGLLQNLRQQRGDLTIHPEDFSGWSIGARFYPLLYMMTRVRGARDLGTGVPLKSGMLGKLSRLEVHHIFPKALLYEHDASRAEANALANFCFLSQQTNLKVGKRPPAEYLAEVAEHQPGAMASQWIPTDPELWQTENYPAFLQARRSLLADDANALLAELRGGGTWLNDDAGAPPDPLIAISVATGEGNDVDQLDDWLVAEGYRQSERDYLVTDPVTGDDVTVVDAGWPTGIDGGYTQPIALLTESDAAVDEALGSAGYRFFLSVDQLRDWVESRHAEEVTVG